MTKVAYNRCFGGFSLSRAAAEWLRDHGHEEIIAEMKQREEWAKNKDNAISRGYERGGFMDDYWGGDLKRSDPLLIECIETLGKAANGSCSSLAIAEVPPGTSYRIDEYDGNESVVTRDDYEWETA